MIISQEELLKFIDEVYQNYVDASQKARHGHWYDKEEFVYKCKFRFSKTPLFEECNAEFDFFIRNGLRIEERPFTPAERYDIWFYNHYETGMEKNYFDPPNFDDPHYEPTPTEGTVVYYGLTTKIVI